MKNLTYIKIDFGHDLEGNGIIARQIALECKDAGAEVEATKGQVRGEVSWFLRLNERQIRSCADVLEKFDLSGAQTYSEHGLLND
jgi:hypothetical protein